MLFKAIVFDVRYSIFNTQKLFAGQAWQRQLPHNLPPASYNIYCPKNEHHRLPFKAAITICYLETPGCSSCRVKIASILEPQQRAHSLQLAAGLASESENRSNSFR